jgi:hypothetical protein
MHRIWAMLLVAVFSFTLIDPGVFAAGERNLPACCRAGGKHHCAAGGHQSSSGPALQSGACPRFSIEQAAPPAPLAGEVKLSQAIFAAIVSHPTAQPQDEAFGRVSFDRSSRKRGPPLS